MKRFVAPIVVLTASWALLAPAGASACSCAPLELNKQTFKRYDAVLIGKLVDREGVSPQTVDLRYEIKRVFRGKRRLDGRRFITVRTARHGASCGIETPMGRREGLLLDKRGKHWTGNLCASAEPRDLRRAAEEHGFARAAGCQSPS